MQQKMNKHDKMNIAVNVPRIKRDCIHAWKKSLLNTSQGLKKEIVQGSKQ